MSGMNNERVTADISFYTEMGEETLFSQVSRQRHNEIRRLLLSIPAGVWGIFGVLIGGLL